jgi:hypothetical protein
MQKARSLHRLCLLARQSCAIRPIVQNSEPQTTLFAALLTANSVLLQSTTASARSTARFRCPYLDFVRGAWLALNSLRLFRLIRVHCCHCRFQNSTPMPEFSRRVYAVSTGPQGTRTHFAVQLTKMVPRGKVTTVRARRHLRVFIVVVLFGSTSRSLWL